jgi:hypothetical protein
MKQIKVKKVLSGGLVNKVNPKKDFIQYAKVMALMKRFGIKI